MQHFRCIMLHYFKEGKNATEMPEKICAVCGEGAVTEHVKSGLRTFLVLLTFWPNSSLLWGFGRCLAAPLTSAHWTPIVGESQHTQNIQTNEVIGGNEKCAFYFKKRNGLFWLPQCNVMGDSAWLLRS